MADAVEAALRLCPWLEVERVGDNVVARTDLGRRHRVLLAGHLDTVPPVDGNEEPRIVDDVLYGRGLGRHEGRPGRLPPPGRDPPRAGGGRDLVLLRRARRWTRSSTGCATCGSTDPTCWRPTPPSWASPPAGWSRPAARARCGSVSRWPAVGPTPPAPTRGATPSTGWPRSWPPWPAYESRRPVLDGCEYVEQLQAVEVSGGVAGNVVPDEASLLVNHRFAPDRTPSEAEASLRELLGPHLEPGDRWELVDAAAGAPPSLDHPVLAGLVAATGTAPRAKQGWTDVASCWAHGIPAANFGPGDPLLAHTPDEHVSAGELEPAAAVLDTLLRRAAVGLGSVRAVPGVPGDRVGP